MHLPRVVLLALVLLGCRDNGKESGGSAGGSLPPVFPSSPASSTNWDVGAGPVMLVASEGSIDTAVVVLPEVTDSTIESVQGNLAPVTGLVFDLFGRGGKLGESNAVPLRIDEAKQECYGWPLAGVRATRSAWRVGFARGHAKAIKLDSI